MRVTATQLVDWSDSRDAQGMLPILVRRLISATSETTALSMPGGDSVYAPGWDGVVNTDVGNAWTPIGLSYWEFGTSKRPADKAKDDFKKRANALSAEEAAEATFVFITSRRWRGKAAWRQEALEEEVWADVLVWDADDLEAWLETSATTTLWMGAQLGVAGFGIDDIEVYWGRWCRQSDPALTAEALLVGREQARDELLKRITAREGLIAVMADSQTEAVGFVCADLVAAGHAHRAACITSAEGWQFVDANPEIDIVVVAADQLAAGRAPRDGTSLIIPLAAGDQVFNLAGLAAKAANYGAIELRRPKPDEFEKAMVSIGVAPADASRFARTMGRSWTVFRRLNAENPAIRKPSWLESPISRSLQVITLVGAWSGNSDGDRACVEQVAASPYEEIESELLELAAFDDAPVLKIGELWKAKAPLELLHLIAPKLPQAMLSRFFTVSAAILAEPDPALELDEDQRWAASLYGKVREHSSVVLEAISDSMAKLAYAAESGLIPTDVSLSVGSFVRDLLNGASEERWMSISPFLRPLAEASPTAFLAVIRDSLRRPEKSVLCLLTETQSSGVFGRCWQANLLWALEILAWYPTRLNQVALILADLSRTEIQGNWGNTPFNSLVSLFRPWYPQTAAPVELRLCALKSIIDQFPDVGWRLLLALAPTNHDIASPNAKPQWRDDDAGAGEAVTHGEYRQFVLAAADVMKEKAIGNAARIADLVPLVNQLDAAFRDAVIDLVNSALNFGDEDKERVRSAIRKFLSWENSFNQAGEKHDRSAADVLRPTFDALAPSDSVIRNAWIFCNGCSDLPGGREKDYEATDQARAALRAAAASEVYSDLGWPGIERLANHSRDPRLIGWELAKEPFQRSELVPWLCNRYEAAQSGSFESLTCGTLHAIPSAESDEFLSACLAELDRIDANPAAVAGFLSNAPQQAELWKLVEQQAPAIRAEFWKAATPVYFRGSTQDLVFCVEKLLDAERPRTALVSIGDRCSELRAKLLVRLLQAIAAGHEPDTEFPHSWDIARVFAAIAKSGQVSQSELAGLEFAYYEILNHDEYGTPNLMAEILGSANVFMELICLAYKPEHSEREAVPEEQIALARRASSMLHESRGVPGEAADGSIDGNAFGTWLREARRLAQDQDRVTVTDATIGSWMSDWPCKKEPESWPRPEIAEFLDRDDCEDVRRGFYTGVRNSRGINSRHPYAGGDQEREIAAQFRAYAARWLASKPNLAALLEAIAESFENEARRHDDDGRWTEES